MLKTNFYLLLKNKYVLALSVVFLLTPFAYLIYGNLTKTACVINYEATYTLVTLYIVLFHAAYVHHLIHTKILNYEIMCRGRTEVYDSIFITTGVFGFVIISVFHFLYSFCCGEVRLFFRCYFVIGIIYIPLMLFSMVLGCMINNFIISSFISWLVFCIFTALYEEFGRGILYMISPTAILAGCSENQTKWGMVAVYTIFMSVLLTALLIIAKGVIRRREYK